MNENIDYKIANIQERETKLRAIRHDILVSDSEKALDMILEAPSPATLIQSFPDQDLYYLLHKIGPYDFIPVLSLATSDQWEYILDVEVWNDDRLDLEYMTKTFDLLFQADPHRLLRWVIKEKPDFFEFYLFKNMDVYVREHDDLPPEDFDDYTTLDDKFYFRFPDKPKISDDDQVQAGNTEAAWELIEKMLKTLAGMDLSVFHGLLLETAATLTAETEEEQFRLKNLRLAEKGFLPTHEAIGIYQPTRLSSLRKRPSNAFLKKKMFDPDIPLPPQFFSPFIKGEALFVAGLKLFDPDFMLSLESELAALINKIISADRIKLRSKEDLERAILKACDYINLGLEVIIDKAPNPALAKNVIETYFLEDVFRTGSRAGIRLKARADKWFDKSTLHKTHLPLSFLGENFLGVVGGLLLDRPLYFNKDGAGPLYRNFNCLADIAKTSRTLDQIIALDAVLGQLDIPVSSFEEGVLTYKSLILTLWAKDRLNLAPTLDPIDTQPFKAFFVALFSKLTDDQTGHIQLADLILWTCEVTGISEPDLPKAFIEVLTELIAELEAEYGSVEPGNMDARFIPHFLLKEKKNSGKS